MADIPPAPVHVGRSLELSGDEGHVMELLVEKLKLLNYEKLWCRRKKPAKRPLSRTYFAYPSPENNQGEYYPTFAGLAGWLLGLLGEDIGKSDDPMQSASNIVGACMKLGFARPGFGPATLTRGWGREVVGVLDGLAQMCLERSAGSIFRPPVRAAEEMQEDEEDESIMATDIGAELEQPQEENGETAYRDETQGDAGEDVAPRGEDTAVLESGIDPAEWALELERATPLLRLVLPANTKDWKSHLDEAKRHSSKINASAGSSTAMLDRIRADVLGQLEKLDTREKLLNEQHHGLAHKYQLQREQLEMIEEQLQERARATDEKKEELADIIDKLEDVEQVVKDSTGKVQDSTPVVHMKKAIKAMVEQITDMDIRIGVARHSLLKLSSTAPAEIDAV